MINKSDWEHVNLCFLDNTVHKGLSNCGCSSFIYYPISIYIYCCCLMYTVCSHHYIAEILQKLALNTSHSIGFLSFISLYFIFLYPLVPMKPNFWGIIFLSTCPLQNLCTVYQKSKITAIGSFVCWFANLFKILPETT